MVRRIVLLTALSLLLAGPARADLHQDALDLTEVYDDLLARATACPDGACQDATAILSELDGAESDREAIHSSRSAMGACGSACESLDAAIADLDDIAGDVLTLTDSWEETISRTAPGSGDAPREPVLQADQRTPDLEAQRDDAGPAAADDFEDGHVR